ncbi:MAG: rhodanese-like domain-containing protein [Nitriliruptoraceae bacterium]
MAQATVCVDPSELKPRLNEAAIIDVRTPGEFESIHLPGSKNRPLDQLDEHIEEIRSLAEEEREVVLVCRGGNRAHQAQEQLAEAGLPVMPILEGGLLAWQATDGPVVQDVIRWDLERQVRLVAGSLVLLSVLASLVFPPAVFVAGFVGAGLMFAAISNTCAMGMLLSKLPYNRPKGDTVASDTQDDGDAADREDATVSAA